MNETVPLKVHNLYKSFSSFGILPWIGRQKFVAVDDISFSLKQGEILGLLGSNGAGKTTTISMLLGIMSPSSGSIEYFGKDFVKHRSLIMQRVSFASTYVRLPGRLTVYENLDFFGKMYNISAYERGFRIEQSLKFFDVWHLKDRKASALSAGETTRTILAKAFLPNPEVVLLDEPTASLDPDIALEVRKFVLDQRKQRNISVIFTSHNMEEVTQVCDRVLVLQRGKIIADDTPHNLASSVSRARVRLVVDADRVGIQEYAQQQGYLCRVEGHSLTIDVDEHKIAQLLSGLTKNNLSYDFITIEKPTLEDYFLSLVARTRGEL